MLGKRPSQKAIEGARRALKKVDDKNGDKDRAFQIWKDLRWKMQTTASSYQDVDNAILDAIIRAKTELLTREIRDPVIERLEKMRARVSEFTVEQEGGMGDELVFCSGCGNEIIPGEWRKPKPSEIAGLYLCAKCAALPGNGDQQ